MSGPTPNTDEAQEFMDSLRDAVRRVVTGGVRPDQLADDQRAAAIEMVNSVLRYLQNPNPTPATPQVAAPSNQAPHSPHAPGGASFHEHMAHMDDCLAPPTRPARTRGAQDRWDQPLAACRLLWMRHQLRDESGTMRGYCHVCDHRVWYFDAALCGVCGHLVHGEAYGCIGNGPCSHHRCGGDVIGCQAPGHRRFVCTLCLCALNPAPSGPRWNANMNRVRMTICMEARRAQAALTGEAHCPPCVGPINWDTPVDGVVGHVEDTWFRGAIGEDDPFEGGEEEEEEEEEEEGGGGGGP